MNKPLTLHPYLDYVGSIEFSTEDQLFYGSVQFIEDSVCYESKTLDRLQDAFEKAVDDYLDDCKKLNRKPNTTCKGSFNVRIPQQLHIDLVRYSIKHDQSLNKTVTMAVQKFLNSENES